MGRGQGVGGGVKPSPPIYQRKPKSLVDWHWHGNFHQASQTKIPHISWAIYRIRRARVGQASLFDTKRRKVHQSERNVTFWGWGVPSPKRKKHG